MRLTIRPRVWLICATCAVALLLAGCTAPVTVQWTTETEMNTAGFNLFRGESPEGPFDLKVNPELIPPAADPLVGKAYSYVDRSARPGTTYYYELQEIELDGKINRYGPITVTAAGFSWIHAVVLGGLTAAVVILWVVGGRRSASTRMGHSR